MKQLPKKLYHVSLDLNQTGVFTPRVPDSRMKDEDSETPRFCVSDTLEGCLTASAFGSHYLDENLDENNGLLKVFVIDTEKMGLTSEDVVSPEELYESGKVADANLTREHWILKELLISEEDQMIVKTTGFDDVTWKYILLPEELKQLTAVEGLRMPGDKDYDYEEFEDTFYELFGTEIQSLCMIESFEFTVVSQNTVNVS